MEGEMRSMTVRILFMAIGLLGIAGCAGDRPNNLGVRDNRLTSCPSSPNCVSSQVADVGHSIAPLAFNGDPDDAFARLKQLLVHRNDTMIIEDSPEYLRVELRTTLFVDDGEFLLDRVGRVIHVRSASRLGYSDLGKNRRRIEVIRLDFTKTEVQP